MPIEKKSLRVRKPTTRRPRPVGKKAEIEAFVKAGVERFILNDATIADFLRTIRTAAGKGYVYSHQLTKSLFSRIVRQAIRKRNRRLKKSAAVMKKPYLSRRNNA